MATNDLQHHAVRYDLPTETSAQTSISVDDLHGKGIKYVRIQWVDLVNNIRYRVIPLPYFGKLLKTSRPGFSVTKAVLGIVFISIAEGFGATGEFLYAIDPSTLKICPYAPGHASVMGWFEEKHPTPSLEGRLSVEVDLCPRTVLRRVVENAKRLAGAEFLVGFETEFILLKKTNPIEAVNDHGWCIAPALSSGTVEAQVLEEIVDNLTASGVEVQMYHAEAAPGQFELIPGPLPALQAVDTLIHVRETIFNVASRHGLRATLAPRVYLDNCGSAAHTHISIHSAQPSPPSATQPNLTILESTFLSGLLQNLQGITLLALPTTASYKRMLDGVWSGGTYICWGTDNREAPVRLCNPHSPHSRNFEIKTLDGTANPYLALAAFLGAGIEGVLEGKECDMKDCGVDVPLTAAQMEETARKELGIINRFPLNWEEARTTFEKSELVDGVFGVEFKKKYLNVNKLLKEQMTSGLTDAEELKKMVENY